MRMGLDISGLQIGECIYVWKSELQGSKQQLIELDECLLRNPRLVSE